MAVFLGTMMQLPPAIVAYLRPATAHEIRSWSFGALTKPRQADAHDWRSHKGTLNDQAIFGAVKGFECACGKYKGSQYRGMICDVCGVKLTSEDHRRRRFGHVDLTASVPHPFNSSNLLTAFPVLPAALTHSTAGNRLCPLYDHLIEMNLLSRSQEAAESIEQVFDAIAPLLIMAYEWDLDAARVFARGMALERRGVRLGDYVCECGYPLAALDPVLCPGCGRRLRVE